MVKNVGDVELVEDVRDDVVAAQLPGQYQVPGVPKHDHYQKQA